MSEQSLRLKQSNPNVLPGLAWMAACGCLFALFMLVLKLKLGHVPPVQSSFVRYLGGLVWLLPVIAWMRARVPTRARAPIQWRFDKASLGRGAAHAVGVSLWFYAIVRNPIADISALSNLGPVYATLGAAVLFGERLRLRRLLAIAASFVGALLIIRPGFVDINSGIYAMLMATPIFAISDLLGKRLAARQSNVTMVLQLTLIVSAFLAVPALWVWQPLTWIDWFWGLMVGLLATIGHICLSQAFKVSEMWVAQSGKFFQLLCAAFLGWVVLGNAVPLTTWLGGGVIVVSISYIAWREAQVYRASRRDGA
ncbi:MAG: DMT family transporter [Granulosicoccaceae bacterium]